MQTPLPRALELELQAGVNRDPHKLLSLTALLGMLEDTDLETSVSANAAGDIMSMKETLEVYGYFEDDVLHDPIRGWLPAGILARPHYAELLQVGLRGRP